MFETRSHRIRSAVLAFSLALVCLAFVTSVRASARTVDPLTKYKVSALEITFKSTLFVQSPDFYTTTVTNGSLKLDETRRSALATGGMVVAANGSRAVEMTSDHPELANNCSGTWGSSRNGNFQAEIKKVGKNYEVGGDTTLFSASGQQSCEGVEAFGPIKFTITAKDLRKSKFTLKSSGKVENTKVPLLTSVHSYGLDWSATIKFARKK